MKRILFGIVMVALLCEPGAAGQSGYELLQQALSKEQAEGKLNEAIAIYQRIAKEFAGDRALAAKTLLRLGEAYRKLGDQKAQQTFESIISQYADQKEAVAEARARLEGLRPTAVANSAKAARQIWAGPGVDSTGSVSADGRFLSFTDWQTGDLAVRDINAGSNRRLTNTGGWEASGDFAELSVMSPDGREVAYSWFADKPSVPGNYYDLRILPVAGVGSAKPRIVQRSDEIEWIWPTDWTPDGKGVVVVRELKDHTGEIAIVSTADGKARVLKRFEPRSFPGRVRLSPDGRYLAYDLAPGENRASRDIHLLSMDGSQESVAVQGPSNDFRVLWSPDGARLLFFSDRTGRYALWALRIEAGKAQGRPELLTSDIGQSPLGITRSGGLYYATAGGKHNVYIAELDQQLNLKGAPTLLTERFLNNGSAAWSPDGQQIAYYSTRGGLNTPGSTVLVIRTVKTGDERDIPLNGLALPGNPGAGLRWFPDGRSLLVVSRSLKQDGLEYRRADVSTGNMEVVHRTRGAGVASNQPDLSPDGKTLFYIERVEENTHRLVRLDLSSGKETELKKGSFTSLAVSHDGAQLAYLSNPGGQSGRSNQVMVMPATGGEGRVLFEGQSWSGASRFNMLGWSRDQRHVFFVKAEVSGGPNVLWRVPTAGGAPVKTGVSMAARIKSPNIHPDGSRLLFSAAESNDGEVWVLENFLPAQRAR